MSLPEMQRRPQRRLETADDCLAAVIAEDTRCAVCGHQIYAPTSVARGIGPECHRRNRAAAQVLPESEVA